MKQKLSKAEAGKLGAEKSRIIIAQKMMERMRSYELSPTLCAYCSKPLPYLSRKKKFCDHSCSAKHSNKERLPKVEWACKDCGKIHNSVPHRVKLYCNNKCRANDTKRMTYAKVSEGLVSDRNTLRSSLIWKWGRKCSHCGLSEWMGKPIPIEVDHIDGNAGNNAVENIRLLCPNCHGITPTWKGRNKGNGRAARGLPLN